MDKQTMENTIGTLEKSQRGSFLRSPKTNYKVQRKDPVVPNNLIDRFDLRGGETIEATLNGKSRSGAPRVKTISTINGNPAEDHSERSPFESLTAIDPLHHLRFETPDGPLSMRILDLLTPIGLGQRGLIVAPPRTGKTILLQQLAHGISKNHPDAYTIILLIDERPEEVTDMRRNVHGEVIASSNDENIASHVRIARLVTEKAKRHVECGEDVIVLIDSLTRLGRAFNADIRGSGRIMSGGLDIRALTEPKSIFGAARNVEGGGSLTIIASALIDTGSRMDEVIFNEFKGTGNMEIMLNREMANRRLWPAIDLAGSGTRKEELLLTPEALEKSHVIRRRLLDKGPARGMEMLLDAMQRFDTNAGFIREGKI
jgi:transcription termination factor Rho